MYESVLHGYSRGTRGVSIGGAGSWIHMHEHFASLSVQVNVRLLLTSMI